MQLSEGEIGGEEKFEPIIGAGLSHFEPVQEIRNGEQGLGGGFVGRGTSTTAVRGHGSLSHLVIDDVGDSVLGDAQRGGEGGLAHTLALQHVLQRLGAPSVYGRVVVAFYWQLTGKDEA